MGETRWTVDDVMALDPCAEYTRQRISGLWDGREALGIAEVCELAIPAADRVWLCCRAPWEVIEPAIMAIVERAVKKYALPCEATKAWAELWLSGEDRSAAAAAAAVEAAARSPEAAAAAAAAAMAAMAASMAAATAAVTCAAAAAWDAKAASEVWAERERQVDDFRALARKVANCG